MEQVAAIDADDDPSATKASGAQTLERGLDLLEAAIRRPRSAMALAGGAGLSRSVAYRLLSTLIARDFLASRDGQVGAGSKLFRLGHIAAVQLDMLTIARPHLARLAEATGLCAFMGRRDGDESVHLLRFAGNERVAVTTAPGTRRHLGETGLGRALLLDDDAESWRRLFATVAEPHRRADAVGDMRRAARAGVVLQFGPPPDSIHSVAAPVRDAGGRIVAAINVAAAAQYLAEPRMLELAPAIWQAAHAISCDLGWRITQPDA